MLIEEKDLQVFLKYKPIHDLFAKTGELVNFAPHIRKELVDAYKNYEPHYHYNERCQACIIEMITIIYRWFEKTYENLS